MRGKEMVVGYLIPRTETDQSVRVYKGLLTMALYGFHESLLGFCEKGCQKQSICNEEISSLSLENAF